MLMKQKRLLTMLVLLVAVATGAWAQWTGGTHTATANENLNAINVSDDATLTINQGVTVTVSGGIVVADGKTLTVTGGGTLVANGANGGEGGEGGQGGTGQTGNAGGTAIAGNVIINGVGLTVTATGGQGGEGGTGDKGSDGDIGNPGGDGGTGGTGCTGGNGGSAFSGAVTIYAGSVTATGGQGGDGGHGGEGGQGGNGIDGGQGGTGGTGGTGGNGGNGGYAFAGTLTVYGGNVNATGGDKGYGGDAGMGGDPGFVYGGGSDGERGEDGEMRGEDGSDGVAYANNVTFQATTHTMTDGTNNITAATGKKTVIITSPDVVPGPPTYAITLAEGTEDADKWTISPNPAEEGSPVTATYSGEKKVKSVKAVKKAAPAVDPAKAYLTWDADQKKLVATEIPAEATKVENSTSYVEWSGTYVVEGNVTISGQITLSGNVNLIIKDGATLTAQGGIRGYNNNLYIYGQANQTGQLVVDKSDDDAITSMKTLEVHSAKLTATSSKKDRGGFYYAGTINVYGGSVDATAANGYGISLRSDGSINIYGGEVKAVGKGTGSYGYGITAGNTATVTVNGGKLWAENADKQALYSKITLKKGEGFSGKIEYSSDKSTWSETVDANAKYVRAGY